MKKRKVRKEEIHYHIQMECINLKHSFRKNRYINSLHKNREKSNSISIIQKLEFNRIPPFPSIIEQRRTGSIPHFNL